MEAIRSFFNNFNLFKLFIPFFIICLTYRTKTLCRDFSLCTRRMGG